MEREAAAYRAKLTPEFLEYAFIGAVANNTKIFFGDRLPSLVLDHRWLRSTLDLPAAPGAAGGGAGGGGGGGGGWRRRWTDGVMGGEAGDDE